MSLTDCFAAALISDEPSATLANDLYGFLVGSWDTLIHDFDDPAMPPRISRGEWIGVRTLLGDSIQDLFIVPSREARASGDWGEANQRYGLTHRQPIPGTDKWRIDYFGPAKAVHSHLIAERQGDEIVQTGVDEKGRPLRWIFYDIGPEQFRWRSEYFENGDWVLLSRFDVTRRPAD